MFQAHNLKFPVLISAAVAALFCASTQNAEAAKSQILYSFAGPDGSQPNGDLVTDSAGNIYGVTGSGGGSSEGVAYQITPGGTQTLLHAFNSVPDGNNPNGGLVMDTAGNLYGVTTHGGTSEWGTIFKITPDDHESVLYNIASRSDGGFPNGSLVVDKDGNLFGTTQNGGTKDQGTVFKVAPDGTHTILYSFQGGTTDGGQPVAGLISFDKKTFYGTATAGGAHGHGVVFKITDKGKETVLYSFGVGTADGWSPRAGLIKDASGLMYGTLSAGAAHGFGGVYTITPDGVESLLISFTGGTAGQTPVGELAFQKGGLLIGAMTNGGNLTGNCGSTGCGVIYTVSSTGTYTVAYTFAGGTKDGAHPNGGIFKDAHHTYGVTLNGGTKNDGTVFALKGK
jgi:uncharacterized repeat protein (TIGR03803 family)